jgi:6-pyruvoyltetrahydropterin/6-carboxytetrahydropterin synthase
MKVTISRKAHFNAAHRLHWGWTWEQTMRFWEECNPNFHGHNYELIVSVGQIDPETGYVMDVKFFSDIIKSVRSRILKS